MASDRVLVVENADWNAVSSQATNDAESLVVATEHDGARWFIRRSLSLFDAVVVGDG